MFSSRKKATIRPKNLNEIMEPSRPALDEIGNKISQIQRIHNEKQIIDVKQVVLNENVMQKPKNKLQTKQEGKTKKCEVTCSVKQLDNIEQRFQKDDPLLLNEYARESDQ